MTDQISAVEAKQYGSGWWLLLVVGVLSVVAGVIILLKPSDSLPTLASSSWPTLSCAVLETAG